MLFFPSLSQIPSSPLPLPISCFSSSIYVSPSFTFPLPLHPHTMQRDHVAYLALSLQKSFPIQPCTFPSSFSSTLLVLLFFPYFFFFPSSSFCAFCLHLFPGLSKAFLLDGDVPAPQPHIYPEKTRAEDSPGCRCAVPSLPPGWSHVPPAGAGQKR